MRSILLLSLLLSTAALSQSTITEITMSPQNPNTNDTIYVYADLSFPYSGCEIDFIAHNVSSFDIDASSHHCLGVAAAICNTVDTFKINPLPAGTYSFNLTLTAGGAPAPCTPGFVIDDMDTLSFTVDPILGLSTKSLEAFEVSPNPFENEIRIISNANKESIESIQLFDPKGVLIGKYLLDKTTLRLDNLESGIYFLKIQVGSHVYTKRISKY